MRPLLNRLHRDERGMSLVFVGMGFMAFLAATTLAIDVGMFMTARSQAQTAADSAALAGGDRAGVRRLHEPSSSGPAVQSALVAAAQNAVIGQTVNIVPSDVTFPPRANRRQQPCARHRCIAPCGRGQRRDHAHGRATSA